MKKRESEPLLVKSFKTYFERNLVILSIFLKQNQSVKHTDFNDIKIDVSVSKEIV